MFNPFDSVNWEKVERTVQKLREAHPDWDRKQLSRELTATKGNWLAATGAVTSMPTSIPGVGTAVTLVAGTSVDLICLVKWLAELVAEIAVVYGRRPTPGTSREGFWVLSSAFGASSGGKVLSKYAVMQASKRAFKRLLQQLLNRIGLRVTQKTVARFIPIVGSLVMAIVNKQTTNFVGLVARDYFEENPNQEPGWEGPQGPDEPEGPGEPDAYEKLAKDLQVQEDPEGPGEAKD